MGGYEGVGCRSMCVSLGWGGLRGVSRWCNGEVRQWAWTGTGLGFGKEAMHDSDGPGARGWVGGGGWGGAGFAPLMKIRSVFGTCMVSGIRRREKVREWDGRSSRRGGSGSEGGEGGGGVVLSDGSKGLEKSVWHPGRIEEDNSSWKWL